MRFGILRLPFDGVSVDNCNIKIYVAGYALVGFNLVSIGISVGDEGIINLRGSVREERKENVGLISGIFLLFAFGVAYSFVLAYITRSRN